MSDPLRTHGLKHFRPPWSLPSLGVCPRVCQVHVHWISGAIQPLIIYFFFFYYLYYISRYYYIFLILESQPVPSLSHVQLFAIPWTAAHPVLYQLPEPAQTHVHQVGGAIQPSHPVVPFSSCLQSFPASESFLMSQLFASGGQSIRASASVLPMNIQDGSPLGRMVGSPCSPRDSQESSPTPQYNSIISLALSFLYGPTLTSIHDYWKNHSFHYMDLCWQNNVCFLICCLGWS